jgi:hypothetical protein
MENLRQSRPRWGNAAAVLKWPFEKSPPWGLVLAVMAMGASIGLAQDGPSVYQQRNAGGVERVAANPQPVTSPAPVAQDAGQGRAALQRAASANRYLFIFFWSEQNPQTNALWGLFESTTAKLADSVEKVAIQIGDPAEKPLVERYGASRAPMPLVLAIAPNGAVTKGLAGKFDEAQLRSALVSRCTEQSLKALQDRKLVLLCIQDQPPQQGQVLVPRGVAEFQADARYGQATEIVVLNPRDEAEAPFLRQLQIDPQTAGPQVVFLAPPGALIGKFPVTASKEQLLAKLAAAQSNPCAGGKCGPNGCGPKR